MIPPPPADVALTQLPMLFDEAAMLSLLSGKLRRELGAEIFDCRPRYVRYKPETSCLVQYDLSLRQPNGEQVQTVVHLKIFADDHAAERAARSKMKRLCGRAEKLHPGIPLPHTAHIPQLAGLLQVYPVDFDMPFLVKATSSLAMRKVLNKSEAFRELTISGEPVLIRYKPERKALLRYDLVDGPAPRFYGKVHVDDRVSVLSTQTAALIDAGVPTPPVLISLPESGFVVHAEAPGVPLASLRGTNDYVTWMDPLADELQHLHAVDLPAVPTHRLVDEAAVIRQTAHYLATVTPHLAERFHRIGEEIASRLIETEDILVTGHGDFYDDQVLVSETGVILIDLDELRRAHPLLDIGNMLAHLTVGQHRGDVIKTACDVFRTRAMTSTSFPEANLTLFEAAALLKLASGPFRRLEPNWPDGIEQVLSLAERRLIPSRRRSALNGPTPISDPALPQLDVLQDRVAMSKRLSEFSEEQSEGLTSIRVVRHKAGRRAILRFDLNANEYFYGKTFASQRGQKVYEVTRTITTARAFGPAVTLPEPVAFLPDLKLLLLRAVPGLPIDAALLGGDVNLASKIATHLHHFHASGLDLARGHDFAQELDPLELRAKQIGEAFPELRPLATSCLSQIHDKSGSIAHWRNRPVHRDFYHHQLLIHEGELAVLDLDDAAMSEPIVDVANFVAHLTLLGAQKPGSDSRLSHVKTTFVAQYRLRDPDFDVSLFQFLTAATLLRLAGIHAPRTNGRSVACKLLLSSELALCAT